MPDESHLGDLSPSDNIMTVGTNKQVRLENFISSGGQGAVYRVRCGGQVFAMKWFNNSQVRGIRQNIMALCDGGPPSDNFIWPIELVEKSDGDRFGYLMIMIDWIGLLE